MDGKEGAARLVLGGRGWAEAPSAGIGNICPAAALEHFHALPHF